MMAAGALRDSPAEAEQEDGEQQESPAAVAHGSSLLLRRARSFQAPQVPLQLAEEELR